MNEIEARFGILVPRSIPDAAAELLPSKGRITGRMRNR
jgi:hypothetical protein